jgi:Leucine-rich repeat (LRR) protein
MSKKNDDLVLTEELVRVASGQFDVSLINTIALNDLGLRSLSSALERCTSLTSLNLSSNRLMSVEGLEFVSGTLQILDISNNSISRLDTLSQFKKLEVLKVQQNRIESLEALGAMSSATMPALRSIYLQTRDRQLANPVCAEKETYAKCMNERFPKLRSLDGHYFLKEQANPMFIDAGDDQEVKLPASTPWLTEEGLRSLVTDPTKAGLITEKAFFALAAESKKLAATSKR